MKNIFLVLGIIAIIVVGLVLFKPVTKNSLPSAQNAQQQTSPAIIPTADDIPQTTIIAENLDTPWALVFLPDKSILVTERMGRVRLIDKNGHLQSEPVEIVDKAKEVGEGGLLGIATHPDFSSNNYIYFYYTYSASGDNTLNKVVRMIYKDNKLSNEQIIVDNIPGASNHNGGRIKFGPDKLLYITTGDAEESSLAQDTTSLAGKILRVTDEGKSAPGNPFGNLVYSYGHRNPQGLAWDSQGNLWATEHGRSGALSGLDELNLIEKGKNYGWPIIQGDETKDGMEAPKLNSGPNTTWAPSGAAFLDNSLFFGGLRGQTLYEAIINGTQISLKEHFKGQFGRIRDVVLGEDNMLYLTTSNQDGRGIPKSSDDRIIRVKLR